MALISNIDQKVQQAKQAGFTDDQIYKFLREKGVSADDIVSSVSQPPEKTGFLKSASKFLFEKPADIIAKSFGAQELAQTQAETANLQTEQINRLIERAKTLPAGSPERRKLLEQAHNVSSIGVSEAEQTLQQIPTKKQAIGASIETGLTLAPTSIGKTALQTGFKQALPRLAGESALLGAGFGTATSFEEDDTLAQAFQDAGMGALTAPIVMAGLRGSGNLISKAFSEAAPRLMAAAFSITKANLKKNPTIARDFIAQGIKGSPEEIANKASGMITKLENHLQEILKSAKEKISTIGVIRKLEALGKDIINAPGSRDAQVILENIITDLKQFGPRLTAEKANEIKRSLYAVLRKSYGEQGSIQKELQKDTARILKEEIEKVGGKEVPAINNLLRIFGKAEKFAKEKIAGQGKAFLSLSDLVALGAGGLIGGTQEGGTGIGAGGLAAFLLKRGSASPRVQTRAALGVDQLVSAFSGKAPQEIRNMLMGLIRLGILKEESI